MYCIRFNLWRLLWIEFAFHYLCTQINLIVMRKLVNLLLFALVSVTAMAQFQNPVKFSVEKLMPVGMCIQQILQKGDRLPPLLTLM